LNKIRVRFLRKDEVKYISHLDLMKFFERAIRRAGLPIAYSQGFNPHPQMVFGLPLSVGVTSEAEYADFELAEDISPEEFAKRLNMQIPEGLKIVEAKQLAAKDNIMKSICAASYEILCTLNTEMSVADIKKKIKNFMSESEVLVKKEGKKGEREVNVRPMVHALEVKELGPDKSDIIWLDFMADAGSSSNLKPELLVSALSQVWGIDIKLQKVHRTGLFVSKGGKILQPMDSEVLSDL